ncbi:MAG: DNA ligase [Candidatus Thioglobus sp.]|nr:DNA ligase [Candidatus Thioglobus sp.]
MKILVLFFALSSLVFAGKPELFLLKNYDENKDIIGWVMSEKLDGIRGFWDGKNLLSRGGNIIHAPKWFLQNYPPFAIDGELWTKRGDFENISSIVRRDLPDNRWKNITHQIFEVPNQPGGLLERLAILKDFLRQNKTTPIRIIRQSKIKKKYELKNFLNKIVSQKGEGVVVRNPATAYKTGRLNSALKVKIHYDRECFVQKILPGKGKYIGKMGSILCKTNGGKFVKIGSGFTDNQRQNPPKIGDEITFKYNGFTKNDKFKFPVFLRIRNAAR